jgi:hypothetical protein
LQRLCARVTAEHRPDPREVDVTGEKNSVFKAATIRRRPQLGQDPWAARTYNCLRIGLLVAVVALGFSILEAARKSGVHCFLGSISGYYYTPVHPVFIGLMVAIGLSLVVIKGRTVVEDTCLTVAGLMAPIVAFIPTSDDTHGVCRPAMLAVGHYQPDPQGSFFVHASANNNLHALVFAGYVAVGAALIAPLVRLVRTGSVAGYSRSFWMTVGGSLVLAITGSVLLHWQWNWLLDAHARAACLMFAFLAAAAGANSWFGFRQRNKKSWYAPAYAVVGGLMVVSGIVFLILHAHDKSMLGGHLVLGIEAVEISLFFAFWAVQTIERWDQTV